MSGTPADHPPSLTPEQVEAEVRANIVAQPIVASLPDGPTVADLALPEDLVRRIADRVLRASFEERHRNVVTDSASASLTPVLLDRERWPELRSCRPAVLRNEASWPDTLPAGPPEARRAAEHVARRLARDGLVRTTIDACAILAPVAASASPEARAQLLRAVGIPTDLAAWFALGERPLLDAAWDAPATAHAEFRPVPSLQGFHAVDEAGTEPVALMRAQLTRPDHWRPLDDASPGPGYGVGSGDNLDVTLRLAATLHDTHLIAVIDAPHADALRGALEHLPGVAERVHVLSTPAPVSQWAQDSLKAGSTDAGPAAIFPRFASRGEDGAKIDAADSAALAPTADELARRGFSLAHSPLHFQGGNVMLVRLLSGRRLVLIGEAEIARNVTLGLSPDQAREGLRVEMGADEALVLPAVGFHLDTELSVRRAGSELVAFVPDEPAGARLVLGAAARSLGAAGALRAQDAKALRTFLEMRNDEAVVRTLGAILAQAADPLGNLHVRAINLFADGPTDSRAARVGNALRVLSALDVLAAGASPGRTEPPWEAALHPHARAAMRSLRRLEDDRARLHDSLRAAGFRVVPVPSMSLGNRSASVINMVHLPSRVLVPVRGGFLRPLDDAALRTLRRELGSVDILAIPCGESERRGGALHCSVNVFPSRHL
jgi:hypothetical protein